MLKQTHDKNSAGSFEPLTETLEEADKSTERLVEVSKKN